MTHLPSERVLVADADPGVRRQVYKRLLEANVFADCVADGRMALERLQEERYCVILLDIALPYVGAERVLEYVRQTPAKERPVVFVLAESRAARSLDVDLVQIVLRKPCNLTQLSDLVQSCVRTATTLRDPLGQGKLGREMLPIRR